MSFLPTYSSSTNRITAVGGFTPTYDADGNTLTDPAHTYSWDSAGKPVAIDTVNMTYECYSAGWWSRIVPEHILSSFTDHTAGKLAIMTGQTLQKAFIPLSGGAQAVL